MAEMIFYSFCFLAVLSSLMVVLLKNPLASGISLILSFFCVSAIFVLMHATFLAAIQILIYTGAILVLFLYVLMLLNLEEEAWLIQGKTHIKKNIIGLLFMGFSLFLLCQNFYLPEFQAVELSGNFGSVESLGALLLGPHAVTFELVSLVLLVGILGVVSVSDEAKGEGS